MPSKLTKKLGPLPVWGWGIVLGGGLLLGIYLRKRFANASSGPAGGGSVPSSSSPAGADTSGGSVGSSVAPSDSGLTADLENALLNSQNQLVSTVGTLGGIIQTDQQNAQVLQQQSFDFISSVTGDLTSLLKGLSQGNGSGGGSSTNPPPPPPSGGVPTRPAATASKTPVMVGLTVTSLESKAAQAKLAGPTSVKATPNKTGVSANKHQGVFTIH